MLVTSLTARMVAGFPLFAMQWPLSVCRYITRVALSTCGHPKRQIPISSVECCSQPCGEPSERVALESELDYRSPFSVPQICGSVASLRDLNPRPTPKAFG